MTSPPPPPYYPSGSERLADQIDEACRAQGWEWHAEMTACTGARWSCALTLILTPDRDSGPDRSLVTLAGNGEGPEEVLAEAWADIQAWLTQGGGEPHVRWPA